MARIEKVGVGWIRKFKNKKEGIKLSINKQLFIAYKNTKATKDTDPNYVIVRFVDSTDDKK